MKRWLTPAMLPVVLLSAAAWLTDTAGAAPADSTATDPPGWFSRQLSRWFAGGEAAELATAPARPGEERFLEFAGRRIRYVVVLRNKAFGNVHEADPETDHGTVGAIADGFVKVLDGLYTGTRERVVREYLLFDTGDRLDPWAVADSERLLRERAFLRDARIFVLPEPGDQSIVDVVIVTQDTWPWGADLQIITADRYFTKIYNRNLFGTGLNVETTLGYTRGTSPEVGHDSRVGLDNVLGSYIGLQYRWRRDWAFHEQWLGAERNFVFPDIRAVGGVVATLVREQLPVAALPGETREWYDRDAWAGWAFRLGWARRDTLTRLRLIPAVRHFSHKVRRRPALTEPIEPRIDQNRSLVLAGLTLTGQDFYRTSLVFGYGETEDVAAGTWISLVGGHEVRQRGDDRGYLGVSLVVPRFLDGKTWIRGSFAVGGFLRDGSVEQGVVDAQLGGFSPLHGAGKWRWRHFLNLRYTRGIRQPDDLFLVLESETGVRALSGALIRGQQRLVAGVESVTFVPFSILGFKPAFFTFAEGGVVAPENANVLERTVHGSLGFGVRIRNPSLVFPTLRARVAFVRTVFGWDTVVSFGSGLDSILSFRLPGPKPQVVSYQ